MVLGFGFAVALLTQDAPSVVGEEARQAGAPIVEQLLREAPSPWYHRRADGRARLVFWTRGRASRSDGLCEREQITIDSARPGEPAAPGEPAHIRSVAVQPQFRALRNDSSQPLWEVTGAALDRACADPLEARSAWFDADSAYAARTAILGLFAVERELARPQSGLIEIRCGRQRNCFDREAMASLIDPLGGMTAYGPDAAGCRVPRGRMCQRFHIADMAICGSWQLDIESDDEEPFRLRRARFTRRANSAIHCGGEES
ncbi:MAG TPA: hypothetical protein VD887_05570 [Allosphingosinicella sp.]|nr:hypothetical protein [Allosphingosinicella sp.]